MAYCISALKHKILAPSIPLAPTSHLPDQNEGHVSWPPRSCSACVAKGGVAGDEKTLKQDSMCVEVEKGWLNFDWPPSQVEEQAETESCNLPGEQIMACVASRGYSLTRELRVLPVVERHDEAWSPEHYPPPAISAGNNSNDLLDRSSYKLREDDIVRTATALEAVDEGEGAVTSGETDVAEKSCDLTMDSQQPAAKKPRPNSLITFNTLRVHTHVPRETDRRCERRRCEVPGCMIAAGQHSTECRVYDRLWEDSRRRQKERLVLKDASKGMDNRSGDQGGSCRQQMRASYEYW